MASSIAKRNYAGRPYRRVTLPPRPKTSVALSPNCEQYTVAWIAALPIELASAMVMLDTLFEAPKDFIQPPFDSNTYTYGSIRKHNVVIANLPIDSHHTVATATTAQSLVSSFPNIQFTLLVGIGGAVLKPDHDIRLGDVVCGGNGVFQHDYGKKEKNGTWVSKSGLVQPPEILRKALSRLVALHEQAKSGYLQILAAAMDENKEWAEAYKHPGVAKDRLFESGYNHIGKPSDCSECDQDREIKRLDRKSTRPHLHNGIVASGNSVIKDSVIRDAIGAQKSDCICLETEAAGLTSSFPSLTIRGISDYSDSHKNSAWQRYASATAAALAKELLKGVPPASFPAETLQLESFETPEAMFLNSLDSCNYEAHKNEIREADHYTCGWFTNNRTANRWWYSDAPYEFLWLTLERSRGKSVLVRNLVDVVLSNPCSLCYFFFKKEIGQSRGSLAAAMRAILHQLFTQKPAILRKLLQQYELQRQISEYEATFSGLWEIFLLAIEQDNVGRVVCLFDAFDDCQDEDRKGFLERVRALLGKRPGENTWVKILLTSRPTERVRFALHFLESELDDDHREHFRHLPGDDQNPSSLIQTEVKIVVENRITKIVESHGLSSEEEACLRENLGQLPKSTYLWVNRILTAIETDTQFSDKQVKSLVKRCFDDALGNKPFPATANIFSSSPPRYQTLR